MIQKIDTQTNSWALMANGSSGGWTVDVDESFDHENEWSVQIQGPQVYLDFQPRDLKVMEEIADFLDTSLKNTVYCRRFSEATHARLIGNFGAGTVTLSWDDEDSARCFIMVRSEARSLLNLTLHENDILSLIEAIRQVVPNLA
jgi:hypothetical protein